MYGNPNCYTQDCVRIEVPSVVHTEGSCYRHQRFFSCCSPLRRRDRGLLNSSSWRRLSQLSLRVCRRCFYWTWRRGFCFGCRWWCSCHVHGERLCHHAATYCAYQSPPCHRKRSRTKIASNVSLWWTYKACPLRPVHDDIIEFLNAVVKVTLILDNNIFFFVLACVALNAVNSVEILFCRCDLPLLVP